MPKQNIGTLNVLAKRRPFTRQGRMRYRSSRGIPGGTNADRRGLVTVAFAEIMAHTPAGTAARYVAELTSAALAEHQPAWWLVPVN
jgi:hypothetical protein